MTLSILCITRADDSVRPLLRCLREAADSLSVPLVLIADSAEAARRLSMDVYLQSKGYLESMLDKALVLTNTDYVLRIDDDEKISADMLTWLRDREYEKADHWKFPRAHLFGDEKTVITNPPLWPDHQTRLSVRKKSGGRGTVHAGSPYGGGRLAPVFIEHHKFLIKSYEERIRIAHSYDQQTPGYGTSPGMLPFSLPENAFTTAQLNLVSLSDLPVLAKQETLA